MLSVQQSHIRASAVFTVVGFFPSGEGFSDTVHACLPEEAKIRVIAGRRYDDEGGDLEVSCVIDAAGAVVDDDTLDSFSIMSESEALESLVAHLRQAFPGPAFQGCKGLATVDEVSNVNAYLELLELVLSDAPGALDGVAGGIDGWADEDLSMRFIDSMGAEHEIIPAEALLALANKSLQLGWNPAAAQIEELAIRARSAVSLAILEAVCE